jgi:hypothetical protein
MPLATSKFQMNCVGCNRMKILNIFHAMINSTTQAKWSSLTDHSTHSTCQAVWYRACWSDLTPGYLVSNSVSPVLPFPSTQLHTIWTNQWSNTKTGMHSPWRRSCTSWIWLIATRWVEFTNSQTWAQLCKLWGILSWVYQFPDLGSTLQALRDTEWVSLWVRTDHT